MKSRRRRVGVEEQKNLTASVGRGVRAKPILSFQFGEQQINPNSKIIFLTFRFAPLAVLFYLFESIIIILWKLKNLFYYHIAVILHSFPGDGKCRGERMEKAK